MTICDVCFKRFGVVNTATVRLTDVFEGVHACADHQKEFKEAISYLAAMWIAPVGAKGEQPELALTKLHPKKSR